MSRKITQAAAIHLGRQKKLVLINLDTKRDWGQSDEYVRGIID